MFWKRWKSVVIHCNTFEMEFFLNGLFIVNMILYLQLKNQYIIIFFTSCYYYKLYIKQNL
jgi:hypothetical protein